MKLKDLDRIKLLETALFLGIPMGVVLISKDPSSFLTRGTDNYNNLMLIANLSFIPRLVDTFLATRLETKTEDYKKLKEIYDKIVFNFASFLKKINITDPVEIFVVYQYMYRSGYLSFNQQFKYDVDMKDFSKLTGADVIRGTGVCRSISSFLTDIYKEMGYDSSNLLVNVNRETLANINRQGNYKRWKMSRKTNNFSKIASSFTKISKTPNHLITSVEKDGKVYIFDPTNDGFLIKGKRNSILLANNPEYKMKLSCIVNLMQRFLGQINNIKSRKELDIHLNNETISYEEYKKIYINTLNFIKDNILLFNNFYVENNELYNDLFEEIEKHSSMFKRMFPELKIFNKKNLNEIGKNK